MKATTRNQMHSALKDFPAPKTSAARPRGPYSKSELDEFKTAMEEMAEQIRHDIRTQKRILDSETQSKEEENEAAYFLNRQTELLRHVEAALARIRMGVFGVCVSCGTRIEKERMLAVPHTQLCVDCKKKGRSARHIVSLSNAR